MALVPCRECKQQVSDQARLCPRCGARLRKRPTTAIAVVVSIGLLSIAVFWAFGLSETPFGRCVDAFNRAKELGYVPAGSDLQSLAAGAVPSVRNRQRCVVNSETGRYQLTYDVDRDADRSADQVLIVRVINVDTKAILFSRDAP